MKNKTILIVDDTIANLDILVELLDEYDVIDATNGKDALEIVDEEEVDLILLDIMMPDMDGYEVCKRLKSNEKTKEIPVIFITAKTDEESIAKAYDVGGSDYVRKPFLPKELLSRVKKELKLQDVMQELKLLALTDPLTKLYNRRFFIDASQAFLEMAKRDKSPLSLLMIDIDKFKNINDTYGHQIGDEIIKLLANIMLEGQRKSDMSCRYGGEEFVVLLPQTSLKKAQHVAQKLKESVEVSHFKITEKYDITFTISVGVSTVNIENEINIEKALKRADDALYEAKENGRNQIRTIK